MGARRSVLLVDDTADIRMLLRQALELDGSFDVVGEAGDGAVALELAEALQPDLVLLDLAMPRMDGLQVLPLLLERSPGSRVVVLSGFEHAALGAEALRLGATSYVQKGRPLQEILAALHRVLGTSAPARVQLQPTDPSADFVALVAHELRGPLTTIRGAAEMLGANWDRFDDAKRREIVAMVQRQSGNMSRLVDDLLTVARLDGAQLSLDREVFDLDDEIGRMAPVDHPDVRLCREGGRSLVSADIHRVEQILANLVSNALHYGAPPVVVTVGSEGEAVLLSVRDHGAGVPEDRTGELFQRFSPLAHGRANANGLGLYIVRELARAHDGDVAYRAASPGAEFVVTLPAAAMPSSVA